MSEKIDEFEKLVLKVARGERFTDHDSMCYHEYRKMFTRALDDRDALQLKLDECIKRYEEMMGLCNSYHTKLDAVTRYWDQAVDDNDSLRKKLERTIAVLSIYANERNWYTKLESNVWLLNPHGYLLAQSVLKEIRGLE